VHDLRELEILERRLLDPKIRRDARALDEMLADEFREIASTGEVFDKKGIIQALRAAPPVKVEIERFQTTSLAPGVALATFTYYRGATLGRPAATSLRSSVWRRADGRWRLAFHQGTLLGAPKTAQEHFKTACAHDRRGEEKEAIPHYRRALRLGLPKDEERGALLGLGSSLRLVGRIKESVALLEKAVKRHSAYPPLRAFRALSRFAAKKGSESDVRDLEALIASGQLGGYQAVVELYYRELTA
jgi:hypothetical protein